MLRGGRYAGEANGAIHVAGTGVSCRGVAAAPTPEPLSKDTLVSDAASLSEFSAELAVAVSPFLQPRKRAD